MRLEHTEEGGASFRIQLPSASAPPPPRLG